MSDKFVADLIRGGWRFEGNVPCHDDRDRKSRFSKMFGDAYVTLEPELVQGNRPRIRITISTPTVGAVYDNTTIIAPAFASVARLDSFVEAIVSSIRQYM